ncbi:hypothetical protein THRCLA_06053 [Thraustotheca clavata]|uniref:Uncharacterized protein n=1 Tax=Thraustotheca clavata TaxID=74557 RepID=A0A1V9ZR82_9STRA|nr:hypothetical protein THRCLA_06053 [Thraustotheca clavata]
MFRVWSLDKSHGGNTNVKKELVEDVDEEYIQANYVKLDTEDSLELSQIPVLQHQPSSIPMLEREESSFAMLHRQDSSSIATETPWTIPRVQRHSEPVFPSTGQWNASLPHWDRFVPKVVTTGPEFGFLNEKMIANEVKNDATLAKTTSNAPGELVIAYKPLRKEKKVN